jgi:hypothetical protein
MSTTGDIDERVECGSGHPGNVLPNSPADFRPCNVGCNVGRTRIPGKYLGGDGYCLKQEIARQHSDKDDELMKNPLVFYDKANSTSDTANHNLFGYNSENKLACCLGAKNDNVSCAVCWCPQSTMCGRDCRGRNTNGMFKILDTSDTKCMEWQSASLIKNRDFTNSLVSTLKTESCNPPDGNIPALTLAYTDIKKSGCDKVCKDGACDANIKKFCDNLSSENRLKNPICACYQPESFYKTIISTLTTTLGDIIGLNLTGKNPRCVYKKCIESDYRPKDKLKRGDCDPTLLNKCIKNMDVRTDGSIIEERLITDDANDCSFDNISYKQRSGIPELTDRLTNPTLNPRTDSLNQNQTNEQKTNTVAKTEEEKKIDMANAAIENNRRIRESDDKREDVAKEAGKTKAKNTNKLLWNIFGPITILILFGILIYLIKSLFRGGESTKGGGKNYASVANNGISAFAGASQQTQSGLIGLVGQAQGVGLTPQPPSYPNPHIGQTIYNATDITGFQKDARARVQSQSKSSIQVDPVHSESIARGIYDSPSNQISQPTNLLSSQLFSTSGRENSVEMGIMDEQMAFYFKGPV